jgi:uncharacterized protein (TIGR02421 family)
LKRAHAKKLLGRTQAVLGSLKTSNLLDDLAWPRSVEEDFFRHKARRLPAHTYAIDTDGLRADTQALTALQKSIEGDHAIASWLRGVAQGAIDRNRLVSAVGTKAFGRLSKSIYGGARSRFFQLPVRNLDLAEHLLKRIAIHGWDEAKDASQPLLGDEAFAQELRRRIAKHRPGIQVRVLVDPHCTSKAIAGMRRLRIRQGATFAPWEADGLFCHEVETHVFTAHNGALQPFAPFLKAGGPRSTPTQEGLAVFAELYNRALGVPRLERLALRVKLVDMADQGASFLDVYRHLLERGHAPRDAYLDGVRIFRGGLAQGGAPFTKDACYLAGLLHVYAFLSAFVRGGFRDEVELLVSGRIALDDIAALAELRAMGLVERPVHRPRWLERWSTLLPYFSFTSFMDAVDLKPVEAHYQSVIAVALSAKPKG